MTALAVMHTQLETQVATCIEIIANTCHFNSSVTGANRTVTGLKGIAWLDVDTNLTIVHMINIVANTFQRFPVRTAGNYKELAQSI